MFLELELDESVEVPCSINQTTSEALECFFEENLAGEYAIIKHAVGEDELLQDYLYIWSLVDLKGGLKRYYGSFDQRHGEYRFFARYVYWRWTNNRRLMLKKIKHATYGSQ